MEGQSTHAINSSGGMILAGELLGSVLEKCCQRRLPAVIAPPDMSTAHGARFAVRAKADNLLRLELVESAAELAGQLACCVSFNHAERTWLFVSKIRDQAPADESGPGYLLITRPAHAIGSDLRGAVRFAVPPGSGLAIKAMARSTPTLEPQAVDLSLRGMSIRFDPGKDPDLAVGTPLEMELFLAPSRMVVRAEVRRREGPCYGLVFPELIELDAVETPEPLQRILAALERSWFAHLRHR